MCGFDRLSRFRTSRLVNFLLRDEERSKVNMDKHSSTHLLTLSYPF